MRQSFIGLLLVMSFICLSCQGDPRVAKTPGSHRKVFYEYYNDIRLQIAELEATHPQLENWTGSTKAFLENKSAQTAYEVVGLYFEKGKDRTRGAHDLADRFFTDGCQIHLIFYTEDERDRYEAVKNRDKAHGQEIDGYLFYYQVFTANPSATELEQQINNILVNTLEKYRGRFPSPDTFW